MAYDPLDDVLHDPFAGHEDLEARRLRAVGRAEDRFREDALRILRAVRFCATLELDLDPETEAGMAAGLEALAHVSAERVRVELVKLLGARQPSRGLRIAERTGVLRVVLPELVEGVGVQQNHHHKFDVWEHTLHAVDATEGDAVCRLAALLHDVAKPRTAQPKRGAEGENSFYQHDTVGAEMADDVLRRLKFSNVERERVVDVVRHHMFWYTDEWTDATVRRFVRRVTPERLDDLFAVRRGDVIARGFDEDPERELGPLRARVHTVLAQEQALSVRDLAIDGQAVMDILARPPGREIGEVLRVLLDKVIEDPELNQADRLRALVPTVAAELGLGPASS